MRSRAHEFSGQWWLPRLHSRSPHAPRTTVYPAGTGTGTGHATPAAGAHRPARARRTAPDPAPNLYTRCRLGGDPVRGGLRAIGGRGPCRHRRRAVGAGRLGLPLHRVAQAPTNPRTKAPPRTPRPAPDARAEVVRSVGDRLPPDRVLRATQPR